MRWNRAATCAALLAVVHATYSARAGDLAIGEKVPKFTFQDQRYLDRTLEEFGTHKGFVLFFSTVECPLVLRMLPTVKELAQEFQKDAIQFVAVNVGVGDSIVEMAAQGLEYGVGIPFVKDHRGEVAGALGVERTATAVVIDGEGRLHYRGRVDGQVRYGGVSPREARKDLKEALKDLVNRQPARVAETPIEGCVMAKPSPVEADPELTYARDVAPLIERHCAECHRRRGQAPFALRSYEAVKAHAPMIAEVVQQGRMPPWYASQGTETFINARGLEFDEQMTLLAWLAGDQPEGDAAELPPLKDYPEGTWSIGKPDAILTVVQPVKVPASGFVPYQYLVLPYRFPEDTWVEAVEILPSEPEVLHHAILAGATGDKAESALNRFVSGYVPGGETMELAPGTAKRIPGGTVLLIQAHYVPNGKRATDRIRVGFRFPRVPVTQELQTLVLYDSDFQIPPHAQAFPIQSGRNLSHDAIGLGVFGHMHYRGRDLTISAQPPGGAVETLLTIPNYSFDWQLAYRWEPGKKRFPLGTRLEALAHYDNSEFNPDNPDPSSTVGFGLRSVDEMLYALLFYVIEGQDLNLRIDRRTGRVVR